MDPGETVDKAAEARRILLEIAEESDIPAVARAAHQADVHCHGILWELDAEPSTTPELDDTSTQGE